MDYARFLRLRRPLWQDFGRRLAALQEPGARRRRGRRGPAAPSYREVEELAFAYRQVLHDHALAANRFPGTSAARQLAALALAGTHRLTRRSAPWRGLRHFVLHAFPAAFQRQLGLLGLAATVFGGSCLLGLVLAAVQPGLGNLLLGPSYAFDTGDPIGEIDVEVPLTLRNRNQGNLHWWVDDSQAPIKKA